MGSYIHPILAAGAGANTLLSLKDKIARRVDEGLALSLRATLDLIKMRFFNFLQCSFPFAQTAVEFT